MLSDKVDATLGAFWNYEGVDLERRGRDPTILRMEKLGVPTYDELVFVARRRTSTSAAPRSCGASCAPPRAATSACGTNPETGVDALLKVDPDLERGLQTRGRRAPRCRSSSPRTATSRSAGRSRREWDAYGRWMFENGLLKRQPNAAAALTNEFLPGEGLDPGTAGAP